MRKSFSVVSAAFCLSVIATAGMAAGSGASSGSSQSVTGTQLGSPQEASPATGGGQTGATVTSNQANQTYPATDAQTDHEASLNCAQERGGTPKLGRRAHSIRQPEYNLQLQQGAHVANVAAVQDDVTAN